MFLNSEPAWHRLGLVLDGTLPAREAFRPGDLVNQYLVGCTSHDGTVAFSVFFSSIRVVCQNTLSAALGLASQANALISRLPELIDLQRQQFTGGVAELRAMAATPCTTTQFRDYVETLFADQLRGR